MKNKTVLDQFKNLKTDDPSSWPMLPKAISMVAIFAAVLTAGYFLNTEGQLTELQQGQDKEKALKADYVSKYSQAVNLDLYKAQLVEVDGLFGSLLKQLPDKSKMESLITEVNQAGISRGLAFDLFKPKEQETRKEFYAELPVQIKVTGDYHSMGQFVSDIAQFPRIVTLNNMNFSVAPTGKLQMEAVAKTFRYLDETEIAAQQAEDKKKAGLSKGKPKKAD